MSGTTNQTDAEEDREIERIMAMSEDDFLAEFGHEKCEAMVAASKRLFEIEGIKAGLAPEPNKPKH